MSFQFHIDTIKALPVERQQAVLKSLSPETQAFLRYHWPFWRRSNQVPPDSDWTYWAILAGRGFGKTRTGAEWVKEMVQTNEYVNLIGATSDDIREIMVEGESGILSICAPHEMPKYSQQNRALYWPNGAKSQLFTAREPERLRGKQHEKVWADELAAWEYPEAWTQMKLGLRLGERPQAVVTTTPKPTRLVKEIVEDPATIVTRGSTYDNRENLAEAFFNEVIGMYEGTRLGRQELNAELLWDTPGALFLKSILDECRIRDRKDLPQIDRTIVAIDPAVSSEDHSNETGIIVAGRGVPPSTRSDPHGYIFDDQSGVYTPEEWARKAVAAYEYYHADRIVAEKNQGGDLVQSVLKANGFQGTVKLVWATKGKLVRAEPISALYEQRRVHHVGNQDRLAKLEDQMCEFTADFDRKKQGYSPDRLDALVWAMTDLLPTIARRRNQDYARATSQPKFAD